MLPLFKQEGCASPRTNFLYLSIGFLVAETAFEGYLSFRQRKCLQKKRLPDELTKQVEIVDSLQPKKNESNGKSSILQQLKDKFLTSREYNLDKNTFSSICSVMRVAVGVGLISLGFQPWAWDVSARIAESWFGWTSEIAVSALFTLGTGLVDAIIEVPISLYSTFVLEEKYGFNKTTLGTFVRDRVIGLGVMSAIVIPMNAGITHLVRWGGEHFYWYCWGFMGALQVVLVVLAPTLIMPLFNKYEPLPEGQLRDAINTLADGLKFPLTKLEVIDGSKRSSHSNAFLYGFANSKKIVLFDTLISNKDEPALECSTDEIVAILGHELGHWKLGHTLKGFVARQVLNLLGFRAFDWFLRDPDVYSSFGFKTQPVVVGLTLFMQIMTPLNSLVVLAFNSLTRHFEFEADEFAVKLGKGNELKKGLLKISLSNLATFNVDPLFHALHHSHPSLTERLSAIDASMRKIE